MLDMARTGNRQSGEIGGKRIYLLENVRHQRNGSPDSASQTVRPKPKLIEAEDSARYRIMKDYEGMVYPSIMDIVWARWPIFNDAGAVSARAKHGHRIDAATKGVPVARAPSFSRSQTIASERLQQAAYYNGRIVTQIARHPQRRSR